MGGWISLERNLDKTAMPLPRGELSCLKPMRKIFNQCGTTLCAIGLMALLAVPFSAAAGGTFINGTFIKGANLPWLDGAFGHDIGTTPVEPDFGCAYSSA